VYDGQCVICNQTKRIISALDWRGRLAWLDAHDRAEVEHRVPGLDHDTALGQVHVLLADGRLVGGFEGTRAMLRQVPLGLPLWLIASLPGVRGWLGPFVYRFIARHRYRINRLVGVPVCESDTCASHGARQIP
jgi:predicted DCC family thiol-disulfide oxidoreductase YuxK